MDNQSGTGGYEARAPLAGSDVGAPRGESLTCHNHWCDFTTGEALTRCPKCGRPLITQHTVKVLGWVLLFLGGLLALGAVSLTVLVAPKLPDVRGGMGGRLFILGLFGLLFAVGSAFMTAGFWQVTHGRRNRAWMTMAIIFLIVLSIIVVIGRAVL